VISPSFREEEVAGTVVMAVVVMAGAGAETLLPRTKLEIVCLVVEQWRESRRL